MATATVKAVSTTAPTGTTVTAGVTTISITVTLQANTSPNSLDTTGGSPVLALSDGESATYKTISFSGSTALVVFTYAPSATDPYATGTPTQFTVNSFSMNGASLKTGSTAIPVTVTTNAVGALSGSNLSIVSCFTRGTLIRTPAGERPVETLRMGDLVTTADGSAKPIKWIGRADYDAAMLSSTAAMSYARPVLFRAGALGDGLPVRDLRVSPMHGMLVDGVLVPAISLMNGVSILRDVGSVDVAYYHIETEAHEILLSEGAPSESYINHSTRAVFDNAAEYDALFGDDIEPVARFPRVEEGYMLAAIRQRLALLAGAAPNAVSTGNLRSNIERIDCNSLHGWVADETGAAVEIEILLDDTVIATCLANRYRTDLDVAGLSGGHCAFSVALPDGVTDIDQLTIRRANDGHVIKAASRQTALA